MREEGEGARRGRGTSGGGGLGGSAGGRRGGDFRCGVHGLFFPKRFGGFFVAGFLPEIQADFGAGDGEGERQRDEEENFFHRWSEAGSRPDREEVMARCESGGEGNRAGEVRKSGGISGCMGWGAELARRSGVWGRKFSEWGAKKRGPVRARVGGVKMTAS